MTARAGGTAQFLAVCRSVKTAGTCENLPVAEPIFTTPGDAHLCRYSRTYTNFSMLNSAKPTSIRSGGKTVRCNVRAVRATTLDAGAHTTTDLDESAIIAREGSDMELDAYQEAVRRLAATA